MLLKTTHRSLLVAVVATTVFGLALRVWQILWGLPFNYHPEEQTLYDATVALVRTGHLEPALWAGPSALAYLCSVPAYALHWVAGVPVEMVAGTGASPGMIAPHQWSYLAAARILVALFGAVTVTVVAYGANRVCRSLLAPLLAALTVAIVPLHVEHSHIVTASVPAAFATAVALVAALSLLAERPPIRNTLLAFGAVGLAAGFEPAGLLGVVPVTVAILLHRGGRSVKLMLLVLGFGTAGVVFLITTPLIVSQPAEFVSSWASLLPRAGGDTPSVPTLASGLQRVLFGGGGVGPVIFVAAALSLTMPLLNRCRKQLSRPTLMLASLVLVWLVAVLTGTFDATRSSVLLTPAFAFMAAFTLEGLSRYLRAKVVRLVLGVLVVVALVPTAVEAGRVAHGFGLARTETQAYEWLVINAPHAARIARDWTGPQLPTHYFAVLARPELADYGMSRLRAANADYIVVSLPDRVDAAAARTLTEPTGFYRELFESPPAAVFCPTANVVAGPEIWIFAQSRRARDLHPDPLVQGACLGPPPY